MKLLKLSAVCIIVSLSLLGCSNDKYSNDKSCEELSAVIISAIDDGQQYLQFDSTHRDIYFDDTEEYDDCYLAYSEETNDINEFGIFRAPNGKKAMELSESCRDYIEELGEDSRAFIASYAPEELPKLDGAQVRRFGNYVVYTVLPEDTAEAVFDSVRQALEE